MHASESWIHVLASVVGLVALVGPVVVGATGVPQTSGGAQASPRTSLRITVTSVMVDDQAKALEFYTKILGFVKKTDVPVGGARWLTVVSPEQPAGPELLLEPLGFPPARTYQKALFDAGIPATSFGVADINAAYERMRKLGVVFRSGPTKAGPVTIAVFEDTCGNLIQMAQQ